MHQSESLHVLQQGHGSVGWNYDPVTDTWSDRITMSDWNHYQEPCATVNGKVYFVDNTNSEVYNPATNIWAHFANPIYIQVVIFLVGNT